MLFLCPNSEFVSLPLPPPLTLLLRNPVLGPPDPVRLMPPLPPDFERLDKGAGAPPLAEKERTKPPLALVGVNVKVTMVEGWLLFFTIDCGLWIVVPMMNDK